MEADHQERLYVPNPLLHDEAIGQLNKKKQRPLWTKGLFHEHTDCNRLHSAGLKVLSWVREQAGAY